MLRDSKLLRRLFDPEEPPGLIGALLRGGNDLLN